MTLIDYFPDDFVLFVDESHVTLPQVRAMFNGDRARKESLIEYRPSRRRLMPTSTSNSPSRRSRISSIRSMVSTSWCIRRKIQDDYNKAHGIVPKTVIKSVREILELSKSQAEAQKKSGKKLTKSEVVEEIAKLEKQMKEAAKMMEFEYAAVLRDRIIELRKEAQ